MAYQNDKPTVAAGKGPVDRSADTAYAEQGAGLGRRPGVRKTEVLEPQQAQSFAWLVVTTGSHAGRIFPISVDVTTVGRDSLNCDVAVDDDAVSLQHCKIKAEKSKTSQGEEARREKQFFLYDLATTNGTRVNGEKILRHPLEDGDRIEIGHTILVFKEL